MATLPSFRAFRWSRVPGKGIRLGLVSMGVSLLFGMSHAAGKVAVLHDAEGNPLLELAFSEGPGTDESADMRDPATGAFLAGVGPKPLPAAGRMARDGRGLEILSWASSEGLWEAFDSFADNENHSVFRATVSASAFDVTYAEGGGNSFRLAYHLDASGSATRIDIYRAGVLTHYLSIGASSSGTIGDMPAASMALVRVRWHGSRIEVTGESLAGREVQAALFHGDGRRIQVFPTARLGAGVTGLILDSPGPLAPGTVFLRLEVDKKIHWRVLPPLLR